MLCQQQSPSTLPTWCFWALRVEPQDVFILRSICCDRPPVHRRRRACSSIAGAWSASQGSEVSGASRGKLHFGQEPFRLSNRQLFYAFGYQDVNQRHSPPHKLRSFLSPASQLRCINARINSLSITLGLSSLESWATEMAGRQAFATGIAGV